MTPPRNIEEILAKRFDGELSREDLERLEEWLMEDSAHIDILIEQTDAHVLMMERGAEGAEDRPVRTARSPLLRMRVLAPLAACLAIIVGAAAYNFYRTQLFQESIVARIEQTSPDVSIQRSGRVVTAAAGMPVLFGDRIETVERQEISFGYPGENTRVRVRENTSLALEKAGGKKLFLHQGWIEADVAPQLEGRPMVVRTPHAEMVVRGTVFSVAASKSATELSVRDGIVRMDPAEGGRGEDVNGGRVALAKTGLNRLIVPGRLLKSIRMTDLPRGTAVTGIAIAGKDVWVYGSGGEGAAFIASVDPTTGRVIKKIEIDDAFMPGSCITWSEGLLWGFSRDGASLVGIDIRTGAAARTIPLPVSEISSQRVFAVGEGFGWLRGKLREELIKIDLDSGAVLQRIICPFAIDRIAASERAVYAGERGWNMCRIDPAHGEVDYTFMCEAESFTGDMAIDGNCQLWAVQGTEPVLHVLELE